MGAADGSGGGGGLESRSDERALGGDAGPPGEPLGRVPNLQVEVEMTVARALVGRDGHNVAALEADLASGRLAGLLLVRIPRALPGHERAALAEQRCRVL